MPNPSATARIATPIGVVELVADGNALTSCRILPRQTAEMQDSDSETLAQAVTQMRDWFAGKRQDFELPLQPLKSPRGEALRAGIVSVPFGHTLTYGGLAAQIGSAPRAVGQACKRNPFPIIVPCHRVTSSAGPENYSGGEGPRTKAWLIAFEQGKAYPDGPEASVQPRLL
jgi:methylated-DNA-[protein]-cysteine S-methyltransferase